MSETDNTILRPRDAAAFQGVSKVTLYIWEKRLPGFPRRIALDPRAVGWRRGELAAWVQKRAEANLSPSVNG